VLVEISELVKLDIGPDEMLAIKVPVMRNYQMEALLYHLADMNLPFNVVVLDDRFDLAKIPGMTRLELLEVATPSQAP
jgi:hypothetical protein